MAASRADEGRPRRALRVTLVVCCIASAAIHLALVPEHLREMPPLGVSFAVAALLLVGAAIGTAERIPGADMATAWLLIGLVAAYAVVLPFEGEPVTQVALATKAIEVAGIAAALRLARSQARAAGATAADSSLARLKSRRGRRCCRSTGISSLRAADLRTGTPDSSSPAVPRRTP